MCPINYIIKFINIYYIHKKVLFNIDNLLQYY